MDFIGDPKSTPFLYFVGGYPVFLPNTLHRDAREVLARSETDKTCGFLPGLVKSELIGGVYTVALESAWFAFLRDFLLKDQDICDLETKLAVLRFCIAGDLAQSWLVLKNFLVQNIDAVSGWSASWQKDQAEAMAVWREGDKYFYFEQDIGQVVRIHGATTTEETRLQFITEGILQRFGPVRRILDLFSVFVVGEDFARNPNHYPLSLRLIAWTPEWGIFAPPGWHLSQFTKVRTFKWRPDNNLCDPEWLAAQLLGEITDDIDRDLWRERIEIYQMQPDLLEDLPRQLDFVLETNLIIGEDSEAILEFEGHRFRWINGTIESRPILSVRCARSQEFKATNELVDRFLSALAWQSRVGISKSFSVGGPKRIVPMVSGSRMHGGLRVTQEYALPREKLDSSQKRLALALFREGLTAASVFYKFLNFWKILELVFAKSQDRDSWIVLTIPKVFEGSKWLAGISGDPIQYLRDSCRNAIAHVHRKPVLDPDNYDDNVRLQRDVTLVEKLAMAAIRERLT